MDIRRDRDPYEHVLRMRRRDRDGIQRLRRHRKRAEALREMGEPLDPDPDAATERMQLEADLPMMLPDPVQTADDVLDAAQQGDGDREVIDDVRDPTDFEVL